MSEETGASDMVTSDESTAGTPIYDALCRALDVEPEVSTSVSTDGTAEVAGQA